MKKAPHISVTEREFKKQKRTEARKVEAAITELSISCAYTPALKEIVILMRMLRDIKRKFSAKEWGR